MQGLSLRLSLSALLLAMVGLVVPSAQGQGSLGSVTGVVTDATEAIIPNATVTIRNVNTGLTREMETGPTGLYRFESLPVGTYELSARAEGFQLLEVKDIKLDVNAHVRINVEMNVGQVTETITVEGGTPLLKTENASVGQIIEQKRVTELPLNGRDFQQLQLLTPGAISTANFQQSQGLAAGASALTTTGTMNVANGNRPGQVLFTIDGANASNQNGRGIIMTPNIDEIQEFEFLTSNMSAEFGYGSSAVNVSVKSGTNELHGVAYLFHRNDALDARSFFAREVEPLKRNQFGANAGGPLVRDRTFWFVSYEGLQLRQGSSSVASVPTAAMRQGDLSALGQSLFDPATTAPHPTIPGAFTRQEFPNAQIPQSRLNSVAGFFFDPQWIPLPNGPGVSGNLRQELSTPSHYNQFTTKIDHSLSPNDTMFGRFSMKRAEEGSLGPYHGLSLLDPGANPKNPDGYNSVLNWTHFFSPTSIFEARASYSRAKVLFNTPNLQDVDYTTQLGIQGFGPGVSDVYPSYPSMGIAGFTGMPRGFLLDYTSNNFEYTASYTMIRGDHTFKMGNTWRSWQQNLTTSGGGSGSFSFNGQFTNDPTNTAATGAALADFYLGLPQSASRYVPPGWYYQRLRNNWAYFNDDWKVSPKLTVNMGVRYEINWPTTEKYGQFASFYPEGRNGRGAILVPSLESVSPPYLQSSVPLSWPTYEPLSVFASDVGISPKYLRKVSYNRLAPRFGMAYSLNEKTVLRAGYGLYYVQLDGNRESEFESVPFLVRESGILNDALEPRPIQTILPAGSSFSPTPNLLAHDPSAGDFGYSQQWNLVVQRHLPGRFTVDLGYVGTKGTRLQTARNLNVPLPGAGAIQPRRPYTDFLGITWNEQSASSIYHALQLRLERRFTAGLSLLTSYTWSKSIDQDSDNSEGQYDPYQPRNNRGLSAFDVPHVFTTGLVYELPWMRNAAGLPGAVLGGWTVGSVLTLQSGFPFTPGFSGDPSNTGTGSRADVVAGCDWQISDPTPQSQFNTSCFTGPPGAPDYRRGNAGRNILRADSYRNVDLAIYKSFRFTEHSNFQLRFEAFNAFNQHTFGVPNATVNNPAFGQVFGSSPGRIFQVAGKLYF